jgi:cytochrome oxidase assembly protein ShyY1
MSDAGPHYLRTARSPRMIGLLVLLLAIAAVCGRLGMWQLDRARQDAAQRPDLPVAVAGLVEVLEPQATFPGELAGRVVTVRGTFAADEVVVTRQLDGVPGVLVVTPLVVGETGAVLAVVRGWAPDAARAAEVPAPPGVVEVRGRLEPGEAARGADGQTAISPAQLVNRWGGPIYSGYLVLEEVSPAQEPGLELVPAPEPATGFDLQNLAYAVQWWLFGGFAVLLWLRMVRDEARRVVAEVVPDVRP